MRIYHNLYVHSSADGRLGCFSPLATKNNGAVSICIQVFLFAHLFSVILGISQGVELLGHHVTVFIFRATTQIFPTPAALLYIPASSAGGPGFSTSSPTLAFHLSDCSRPRGYKVPYCDPLGFCALYQALWGSCSREQARSCPCCPVAESPDAHYSLKVIVQRKKLSFSRSVSARRVACIERSYQHCPCAELRCAFFQQLITGTLISSIH